MEVEGFLLGSGFALLIVLLGWASQITSRSKETRDLEAAFLAKAKLKRPDYKRMIDEGGGTEDSFNAVVQFLYSSEVDNVAVFNKIKPVKEDAASIDRKYSWRFWVLLLMSICLFVSAAVAFFLPPPCRVCMLVPNAVFVVIVFCNLITVHNLEKRHLRNMSEAMEKL